MANQQQNPTADVLGFMLGTVLVVLGDALYGASYYEGLATDHRWFIASAFMGGIAGLLYIRGGRGLVAWMEPGPAADWTRRAFFLFGYTLAIVHAVAGAMMIPFDAAGRTPNPLFGGPLAQLDELYGALAAPMFCALIVAFGLHGVQTLRGRAGVPRWTAAVNPLVLAALHQSFAEVLWFPLRSAALGGTVHLGILLVVRRRRA